MAAGRRKHEEVVSIWVMAGAGLATTIKTHQCRCSINPWLFCPCPSSPTHSCAARSTVRAWGRWCRGAPACGWTLQRCRPPHQCPSPPGVGRGERGVLSGPDGQVILMTAASPRHPKGGPSTRSVCDQHTQAVTPAASCVIPSWGPDSSPAHLDHPGGGPRHAPVREGGGGPGVEGGVVGGQVAAARTGGRG